MCKTFSCFKVFVNEHMGVSIGVCPQSHKNFHYKIFLVIYMLMFHSIGLCQRMFTFVAVFL